MYRTKRVAAAVASALVLASLLVAPAAAHEQTAASDHVWALLDGTHSKLTVCGQTQINNGVTGYGQVKYRNGQTAKGAAVRNDCKTYTVTGEVLYVRACDTASGCSPWKRA